MDGARRGGGAEGPHQNVSSPLGAAACGLLPWTPNEAKPGDSMLGGGAVVLGPEVGPVPPPGAPAAPCAACCCIAARSWSLMTYLRLLRRSVAVFFSISIRTALWLMSCAK